ncbi:restriction endonuclease subunit S [Komagataeibacter saccharivorans]|uniref:restriction endonuclease subunit S n=1 Tax=Komagataeibacter saccharivorans TaxID=265959 RepID=UPI0015E11D2E|nr:restriction endonuclease subunit S [Komagataeibacter saccharivorans]
MKFLQKTLADAVGGAERISGGPFGSKLTSNDYRKFGIPVIRGSNMESNGRWIGGNFAFVSVERAEKEYKSNIAKIDDIIVTQRGTLGQVSIVPKHPYAKYVISQSQMAISPDKNLVNSHFIYYYLKSPQFSRYADSQIIQTGVPHINLGILRNAPCMFPDLDKQKQIAATLGFLDDKIDLNRRTNETLEAMARALFRDWFVDFGPTRAKMAGKAPYLAPELWELFPDRLDEEGKPEGWQSLLLADLATLSKSSINPAQFSDEYFLHFSLPAFDKGMMPHLVKGEAIKSGKFSLPSNSILLSKLNPETPRVWMVTAHEEPYQRICSTEFMVLNPCEKDWLALIYCACLSQPFREILQGMVTGTSKSHQRVQPLAAMQTHLLHATDILMRQFGLTAQPLLAKINFNRNESNTLAQLRDFLLPKLMSGNISVRDAEKMVEDAA